MGWRSVIITQHAKLTYSMNMMIVQTKDGSILHVCGDDPISLGVAAFKASVFSTYVEMILGKMGKAILILSILYVCGDDPQKEAEVVKLKEYSPRRWR